MATGTHLWQKAKVTQKMRAIMKRLEKLPHLGEHERLLIARSLAATPDERWRMSQQFLRSLGLSRRSDRKKYGFKS